MTAYHLAFMWLLPAWLSCSYALPAVSLQALGHYQLF